LHHGKEIVRHLLRRFARGDVREQRLSCQVQRALAPNWPIAYGGTGPEALPKLAIRPNGPQAVEAGLEGVLADRVVDDLDSGTGRLFA
jgi:hypothetical protein